MARETKLYKMSDLVRLSGVSRQTIHFYLREGLLLPPVRTSRNMAYYHESTVDDIRLIKDLQEKRYLPLAVIKEVLKARREGRDLGGEEHLLLFETLFVQAQGEGADQPLGEAGFSAQTGLADTEVRHLVALGIFSPDCQAGECWFDRFDLALARALGGLLAMGMRLQDLELYRDFLQCARREARLVHDRMVHRDGEGHPSLKEIYARLERVKGLLTAKAYREYLVTHEHAEQAGGGEDRGD
ncbi:MAG: MerR family transcriptional regulator [Syntrophomonadaceae bacterium]|jgi:DNA-binding transcriptional MerR regulator|nr:MerR family transcriptional regulator [Syntrophomonadaceae bacterium]